MDYTLGTPLGTLANRPDHAGPSPEVSLASLLAAGQLDELAFADLYARTSRLVLGTVRRVLRDHAQADEVVQEAYSQAWEKAATYRGDLASVTTWLLVIARRRAIDRVRSDASLTARDTTHLMTLPATASSAEDDVLAPRGNHPPPSRA